jgi:carboxymethylenebutenolidase
LSSTNNLQSETTTFEGSTGKVEAYVSRPKGLSSKLPGVVVIHEIFGLNDHFRDVANRFAAQGYVAIAPNLFSRQDLKSVLTEENIGGAMAFMKTIPTGKMRDRAVVQEGLGKIPDESRRNNIGRTMGLLFGGLPRESLVEDLSRAVDYLNEQDYVSRGKIGCVGFCFGGTMSFALGCKGKTAGTVIFYGENPEPIEQVQNIASPILGIYGGDDERINMNLDKLVKAMTTYKKDFEMRIYPGAPHAFFNDTSPQTYRPDSAREAWDRVLRFYRRTLS